MSEDIVKTLLESLTPEQKQQLVQCLSETQVTASNAVEVSEELQEAGKQAAKPTRQRGKVSVNDDFTISRDEDEIENRKQPVRAKKNQWVDTGEERDPNFDPAEFEKKGRVARNRQPPKEKTVECHVCGRSFKVKANLVYGEYIRCNRCVGK